MTSVTVTSVIAGGASVPDRRTGSPSPTIHGRAGSPDPGHCKNVPSVYQSGPMEHLRRREGVVYLEISTSQKHTRSEPVVG